MSAMYEDGWFQAALGEYLRYRRLPVFFWQIGVDLDAPPISAVPGEMYISSQCLHFPCGILCVFVQKRRERIDAIFIVVEKIPLDADAASVEDTASVQLRRF